jgi:asparagine synthase (glutamine-hydrolysing)
MCGIAGIVNLKGDRQPPDRDALIQMGGAMLHRGPDEFGIYRDRFAGLAHTRLSIVDLSSGQQPLTNESETLWIVFNGEIFNHLELRDELEALGHRFRTRSDTEVIVHAYEAWGEDAFVRMNGQWALALWDATRRRLVLCRDRFGVRPLYVCEHQGAVYFASEIKAIFAASGSIPRVIDPVGIDQTFTFWSVIAPRTVFSGVEELRPACLRVYESGHRTERVFWEARYPELPTRDGQFAGSIEDAAEAVGRALEKATSLRITRSDVPVGSYLSGGLDSALIATYGARYASSRFQTFSLGFDDSEYDETGYQQIMAQHIGSEHHQIVVKRKDIADVFPDVVRYAERPILRTAPAPLFLLSRLVRQHGIKVVLTGEGADEMFAGYDLFREGKVRRFWAKHPGSRFRSRLLERLYPYLARSPVSQQAMARQFFGRDLDAQSSPGFAHATRWQTTSALKRLLSRDMREEITGHSAVHDLLSTLPSAFPRWTHLAQDQYLENRTLLSGYLLSSQGDRMLMAHSVEGRFPFLDKDVVALADSLPPRYKLRVLDEKHVLKRIGHGTIPEAVLTRKKQPYRAPDALSFVGDAVPEYVHEMLNERFIARAGIFEPTAIGQLWSKCRARRNDPFSNADNMALVGVISAQLLYHQYVCQRPGADSRIRMTTDIDRLQPTTANLS